LPQWTVLAEFISLHSAINSPDHPRGRRGINTARARCRVDSQCHVPQRQQEYEQCKMRGGRWFIGIAKQASCHVHHSKGAAGASKSH
jgi:hypothetical protein